MKRRILALAMVLALVSVIISPMSVFAATTGSTQITGNVPATISLTGQVALLCPALSRVILSKALI